MDKRRQSCQVCLRKQSYFSVLLYQHQHSYFLTLLMIVLMKNEKGTSKMNVEMLCIMIMLICTCRYLAVPESDHLTGLDPLNWWSVNATNYPIISVLAKKYLAIPASSASSERVFSTAKNITDKKRWRLLPERLHKTIFLRHNQYFWK